MGVNRNAVSVGAHYGQACPGLWHRLWQMCLMCRTITMLMTMRPSGRQWEKMSFSAFSASIRQSWGLSECSGVNWTPNLGLESSLVVSCLSPHQTSSSHSLERSNASRTFLQFPDSVLGWPSDSSSRGNLNHQGVLKDASEGPVQGWGAS